MSQQVDFLREGDNYPCREGEPSCFLWSSVNLSVVKSDWEPAHWARGADRLPAILTQSSVPGFQPHQLGPGSWGALEAGLPSMPASHWAEPCVPFSGASSPSAPLFSSPRTGSSPSMAPPTPCLSDQCSDSSFRAGFPESHQSGRGSPTWFSARRKFPSPAAFLASASASLCISLRAGLGHIKDWGSHPLSSFLGARKPVLPLLPS